MEVFGSRVVLKMFRRVIQDMDVSSRLWLFIVAFMLPLRALPCDSGALGSALLMANKERAVSTRYTATSDAAEGASWWVYKSDTGQMVVWRTDFGEGGRREVVFVSQSPNDVLVLVRGYRYPSPIGSNLIVGPSSLTESGVFVCNSETWIVAQYETSSAPTAELAFDSAREALKVLLTADQSFLRPMQDRVRLNKATSVLR